MSWSRQFGRASSLRSFLAAALVWNATAAEAQQPTLPPLDPRVQERTYVFPETGETIPYALFVPAAYDAGARWPLILALHGAGSRHLAVMRFQGFVDFAEQYGYIVVAPLGYHARGYYGVLGDGIAIESFANVGQSTDGLPSNLGKLSEQDVLNVFELTRREFSIDEDRVYLFGHSMGGAGAYHIAAKEPPVWAGIAVAAPGSRPLLDWSDELARIRDIPVLVIHGDEDATIPVGESRKAAATMRELGMQFVYTEIRGGDHQAFIASNRDNVLKVFSFFNIVRRSQRPIPN